MHKAQSYGGMRLLKMDLLKSLKMKKDPTLVGDQIYKNYKQSRQFVTKDAVKVDAQPQDSKKVTQELTASQAIDKAVKNPEKRKPEIETSTQ